ncbi:MAG: polyprenyl synthetase family protein [Solirubrobacterales bacterium]|nr:polyprenyl synthetase family protein [Solirubrobacterales bacterium]
MAKESPEPVTAVIETAGEWLPSALGEVEECLDRATGRTGPLAGDASATLRAGGKRMRPMLVLLSAGPEGGDRAVRSATAVELVHMASLVHDDVLDRAPLRRGRPTVYAESGRARATDLGDALFAEAFGLLARAGDDAAVAVLSETTRDLVTGELVQRSQAGDMGLAEDDYLERCRLKTGSLFSASCALGALAPSPEGGPDLESLAAFGGAIGLAFQMLDDVLDISGPEERTGKAPGTDLLDGTVTLPVIVAIEREPAIGTVDLDRLDRESALELAGRIEATGALDEVRGRAIALVEEAKRALDGTPLPEDRRTLLDLVADGVVLRYS